MKYLFAILALLMLCTSVHAATDPARTNIREPRLPCSNVPLPPECPKPLSAPVLSSVVANPIPQACGTRPGTGACCRRVYDPNGDDGLGSYDIVCDGHGVLPTERPVLSKLGAVATQAKKFFRCYVDGYDPPVCFEVSVAANGLVRLVSKSEPGDISNALNAAQQLVAQRDAGVAEPVLNCHNGHGQTGCCRIVGDVGDGSVIIECGR